MGLIHPTKICTTHNKVERWQNLETTSLIIHRGQAITSGIKRLHQRFYGNSTSVTAMDLSVILNPPSQSQCSVDLGGKMNWHSQLHSPFPDPTRVTRRGFGSEIHREDRVNASLGPPPAVFKASNNNRVFCPSSSAPSFAPPREFYRDQIQNQASSTKASRQRSITHPSTSSRSLKDSLRYSPHIVPAHQLGQIHLQSSTMVLPHCSSLDTLASVATASAAGRQSSRTNVRARDTSTEIRSEATLSCGSANRPRAHSLQEVQHHGVVPDDLAYLTNPDSRRSSYVSSMARVDACQTDPTSATEDGPSCSYTAGCSTGSPLRKVVSHIFGRNKLCTRQIPKGVWVHYCRKHYQRSRYRNPNGFAILQCDLVRKQIDRLDMWGGVSDWIIKVRKREELRLNKENAELAAGRITEDVASDGDDDTAVVGGTKQPTSSSKRSSLCNSGDDHLPTPRRMSAATASATSSRWLIKFTGSGKTTEEALAVLDIIESEIRERKCHFPDIEILPNVSPPSQGSDHQRSLSSWSSSSLSSLAHPDDSVDHHETQGPKLTIALDDKSSPPETSSKRRTLQRGTRPSMSDDGEE